ncbi:MAG: thymidine kinase [Polyangiaceae bacterium]|jgi:thymidine kinase
MSRLDHGEHLASRGSAGLARMGCIEVVCGSMFSGKTEELLRRLKRARLARQQVQLFKPRLDDRYDAVKVVSHEGMTADAVPVASADEILERTISDVAVVGIDEVQFFDGRVVPVAQTLADRGVRVIAAGLDQDYRGEPFGPIAPLLAIAEYVTKLHAVCAVCGAHASRSQRLVASEGQLFVGGAAAYEARCRGCFVPDVVEAKR